jgi:hypothetical protein
MERTPKSSCRDDDGWAGNQTATDVQNHPAGELVKVLIFSNFAQRLKSFLLAKNFDSRAQNRNGRVSQTSFDPNCPLAILWWKEQGGYL